MTKISFVLRRSRYHWLMLLTLVLGVLLATAFLASGPILIDVLMEAGLRRTLLNADLREDIFYLTIRAPSNQEKHQTIHNQVQELFATRLDHLVNNLIPAGHVGYLYPWKNGKISLDRRLTLGFYGVSPNDLRGHIDFVEGAFPEGSDSQSGEIPVAGEIPVFIGAFLADDLALRTGDLLPVSVGARVDRPELNLRITGIIRPKDYQDPYWLDHFNPFWPLEDTGEMPLFGVFIPQESFFSLAEALYPSLDVSYSWQVNMQLDQVAFEDIDRIQNLFNTLGEDLSAIDEKLRVNTTLVELLSDFTAQANTVRAPLYFLLGIVVLMALYYLVMMSSLYFEQIRPEFAILSSRGATGSMLFKLELMEGIIFSGIAILSGPILAWLNVRWLASSGPLAALTEPGWGLSIPQAAWLSASVAAVASLGSLLSPLPGALKQSITTYQQNLGRASRPPWWQHFYLDVFALAIGIILLYRVELYGSIIGGSAAAPQLDLMLVLAPLCLLLGAGAIFLRIFPAFLRKSAGLASRGRGLPMVMALQHAARDPRHVTRLVLLLMLAMALGLFSTSLDATLTMNEADRSDYYVGSDLRVIADPEIMGMKDLPNILGESWVWRTDAALNTSGVPPGLDLLAVDPETFSDVARYRSDFATQPVAVLLEKLETDWEENWIPLDVAILPGVPAQIGLWFSLPFSMQYEPERFDMVATTTFEARLRPVQGEDIRVTLHPGEPPEDPNVRWYYFQGEIPTLNPGDYPLRLVSLWLHNNTLKLGNFEAIWVDDIVVFDGLTQEETIVESFEYVNQSVWKAITYPMRVHAMESHPHTGKASISMHFDTAGISPLRWYGFHQVDDLVLQPIPALASPSFIERTESQPGELLRIRIKVPGGHEWDSMTFKIVDVVNYFPTLYETKEAGFLVTLQAPLFEQIDLYRYYPLRSNELLISSNDAAATRKTILESGLLLNQVLSADLTLQEIRTNPLAIGLRSVTLFGYYLTTVLSLIGFGTHFYLTTRQRTANYSILRALGLSPGQLYNTLLVEQIVLMLSGLAFGTVLGILLNQLTLSGLPLRLGELDTIPPFIVQTDWSLVVRVYLTLVSAFLLSLGIASFFLWRVKIHRVLRIGEE